MAIVALPLLLVFLFAVIDLGRVVFLGAEANTAAYAVCRRVEDRPETARSHEALQEAAVEASPSLAGEGLKLEVVAAVGEIEERTFVYRLRDGEDDSFSERPARTQTRSVEVHLAVGAGYLTPLGTLIASAQGKPEASFLCEARVQGLIDETVDGGVQ